MLIGYARVPTRIRIWRCTAMPSTQLGANISPATRRAGQHQPVGFNEDAEAPCHPASPLHAPSPSITPVTRALQ